jgi:hypothetical protein
MEISSGTSGIWGKIDAFVGSYSRRRKCQYLEDDLRQEAYLMAVEEKLTDDNMESVLSYRFQEMLHRERFLGSRSTSYRHKPVKREYQDMAQAQAECPNEWRNLWECCRNETEWQVVKSVLSGHSITDTAGQLEMAIDDVKDILERVYEAAK